MAIGKNSPTVRAQYSALAIRIQEAATSELSNNDIGNRLRAALSDAYKGSGTYCYVVDYFGDAESGDLVYSCGYGGSMKRCSYSLVGNDNGSAAQYELDVDGADEVFPRTVYESLPDEDDHYSRMEESLREASIYTGMPLYERFVSKKERDAADASDFAGKGKSFPILKAADVSAASHALGLAGSSNLSVESIKKNIVAIAKRKGWSRFLPKAWQDGGSNAPTTGKESGRLSSEQTGTEIKLVESAGPAFLTEIRLSEAVARTNYPVKLISPGTGTMAHYPEAVLERDGPKVFKKGTLMFWNHPTKAEESARPEGDLDNLAAILTKDAYYDSNGPKGAGLYSEAKVMADYAQKIEERAPYIGLSIRAGGQGTGKVVNGKPELKSIDYAESVDYVTKAGRGGIALAEAARDAGILTESLKECPECQGTGDCPTCEGTGKVAKVSEAKAKGKPKEMMNCPDCKGTGDCAKCAGDGKLKESAVAENQEKEMDETQVKQLMEAAIATAVTPLQVQLTEAKAANVILLERALKGDARQEATSVLSGITTLPEATKDRIITESLKSIPTKDGALDAVKFREAVNDLAKVEGEYLAKITGAGRIHGMGSGPAREVPIKEAEAIAAEEKRFQESAEKTFGRLMGGDTEAAKAAASKGVAA